jgi:hypothetical protein
MTLCRWVKNSRYLEGMLCIHIQGQEILLCLTLTMKHYDLSKHLVLLTQRHSVTPCVLNPVRGLSFVGRI